MSRGRYTFSTTDETMMEHLAKQKNVSRYVRSLIEADMGLGRGSDSASPSPLTNLAEIMAAVLAELRQISRKLDSMAVVGIEEGKAPATRKEPSEGLRRQVSKFKRATLPRQEES